jgi:phosphate ABC transporter permease subunit PstA/phosphate ABC transporter phosphate-binding protein
MSTVDVTGLAPQERRNLSALRRTDVLALVGAVAAAVATTAGLVAVLPITGVYAWVGLVFVSFIAYYAILVAFDENAQMVRARVAAAVIHLLAMVLLSVLVLVVGYTLLRGFKAMVHWNFYTQDATGGGPNDPLTQGGIKHAIIGSLEQISIALVITVPVGVTCAVFLTEFPGGFARFVRTIVEAMTALPSIIAGLFIYAMWIITLGNDKSGLAAALALSVMMLPIIIRASDVVLRLVPGNLKEASYALGSSRWRTVWHVVLPTARSGLTTAVILGTARGIGETSPVLLTSGANIFVNANPTKGPQVSLPLMAFLSVRAPSDTMITRGFGAAAFLLMLVLVLFVIARVIGGRGPGHLNARQRRANQRASRRDLQRMAARAGGAAAAIGLIAAVALHPSQPASADGGYVPISGAGSTWSANAMSQWQSNVVQYGMKVNFNPTGSSDGRNQFKNGTVDFAVSEIPYGLTDSGVKDLPPDRKYAYMPIVAGGTAFMYNLKIGGKRVTNLRLSGENIARIFTGKATMWNDAKIKKDNPGLALPARRIVPVVRADGSGTTAQLTTWMSKKYASLWDAYCAKAGRPTPCGVTSSYPVLSGSGFTAQSGSLGVSGYVKQDQNEGTITYVEYSYALNTHFPVVKLLNKKGYYVEPKAANVAVGLLGAKINTVTSSPNYLTQILDGVYDNPDARAYPLSSYSYMILPTEVSGSFTTAKGKTLGAFGYYFLCEGQQQADTLGYSPLPKNLVTAGFDQLKRIPGVNVQSINLSKCHNPTFSATGQNTLATTAPFPPACDKIGATQCSTGTGGSKGSTPTSSGGGGSSGGTGGSGTTGGGSSSGGGATNAPAGGQQPGTVDPDTGEPVASAAGDTTGTSEVIAATPQNLGANYSTATRTTLMAVAGAVLLMVVLVPPLVALLVRRRKV